MDISARVRVSNASESADISGEEGLLGMVFHPGYATNGFFYLFYTGNLTSSAGTGRHDVLSRFQVSSGNPNQGDPNSEVRFITQWDEANNHNAGDIHFGPDGYLYVSLGDEGGGYDDHHNSQRIDHDFFSAIMRIDVDNRLGNLPPNPHPSALPSLTNYSIPFDNPWVGATNFNGVTLSSNNVRTEFWAVGMRNPWRWSFDPATGDLYLGHVGQGTLEWVDIVTNGANCGWNYFEGDKQWTNSLPAGFSHTHPLIEYGHTNSRNCIIGGIVYHGSRLPLLNGAYLYGDYGSGEVWSLRQGGGVLKQNSLLFRDVGAGISCFGVDPSNSDPLYAAVRSGVNSMINRIVMTNSVPSFTSASVSGTNIVLAATNGNANATYYVLASTNAALTLPDWTPVATNAFDSSGNFRFTNGIDEAAPQRFYILELP